jgi:hypothetical protein
VPYEALDLASRQVVERVKIETVRPAGVQAPRPDRDHEHGE